ncbi:MAG: type II and III secretion system protein family protein [Paracoccaceae bacterium]|nr:type II and III secretion system protein family protein [Paracoccaceae bacterium]
MKKLLTMALVACLMGGLPWGGGQAAADSHSVLRLVRGQASDNITVLIGRAIVVESNQPFIEVSVADPAVADVSPLSDRSIYIFGKGRGSTTLTLLGENGQLITNVTVKVVPDLAELKQRLKEVFPNEPIKVRLTGGNIVLSGVISGKAKISRAMSLARSYVGNTVVNMMSVGGTQQVMLKVRVAEMSRTAAKELGFNTFLTATPGSDIGGGIFSGSATNPSPTIGIGVDGPTTFTATGDFGVLGAIAQLGDFGLGITLTALEQKGFSRTLAEPNLVALSGNEANFLAGQDVPIPQVNDDGEVEITFKPVGVSVNFIPTVLDDDLINLELSTEVSAIDTTTDGIPISATINNVVPIFSVRRATTAIELRDGQSFAIAGLLQDNFTDAISQFPFLGDIPILGTLFRSTDYARGETELVIIVSVHLVVPVSEDELSVPFDHVRIPNELELFLMGNTTGAGAPGLVQSQDFDGDFGYVVE